MKPKSPGNPFLSAHLREKHEKIHQTLTQLAEESAKGTLIVVEGKKDVQALRELNIWGAIFTLKTGGKSFTDAVTEIERTGALEVILLLDFDRRGKLGTKRLKTCLEHAKVTPNLKFWRTIFGIVGGELQCVEGLPSYTHTLAQKANCL